MTSCFVVALARDDMRLFVAVDLSTTRARRLRRNRSGSRRRWAARTSLKWVKPDHAHLTLVFLGNVDAGRATSVVEAVGRDVDLRAVRHGSRRRRCVSAARRAARALDRDRRRGRRGDVACSGNWQRASRALGIALEDRPFHPHLTLGRWRESRPSDRDRALAAAQAGGDRAGPRRTRHAVRKPAVAVRRRPTPR